MGDMADLCNDAIDFELNEYCIRTRVCNRCGESGLLWRERHRKVGGSSTRTPSNSTSATAPNLPAGILDFRKEPKKWVG